MTRSFPHLLAAIVIAVTPAHAALSIAAPSAVVGQFYTAQFTANFGQGPYYWYLDDCNEMGPGIVPPGLSFDATGKLSGTPTTVGTYKFCGYVYSANEDGSDFTVTVVVLPQGQSPPPPGPQGPMIITPALPEGTVNLPYIAPLSGAGQGTLEWRVAGGSLPLGLSISLGGVISGRPEKDGTFEVLLELQDATTLVTRKLYTIIIRPPVTIQNACPFPDGTVGEPYRQVVNVAGGRQPYLIAILSGVLPRGVVLADTIISGTPTEAGLFEFILQAVDRDQARGAKNCSIRIVGGAQAGTGEIVLRGRSGGPPVTQAFSVSSASAGQSIELRGTTQSGGNWLSLLVTGMRTPLTAEITGDPLNLAPNTYLGSISLTPGNPVPVRFIVDPAAASFQVNPGAVQASVPRAAAPFTRSVVVSNTGSGRLTVFGQLELLTGSGWLSASGLSGTLAPGEQLRTRLDFLPAILRAGIFRARLRFRNSAGSDETVVPVTLAVSDGDPLLQLSQSALSFRARAGGRGVPGQPLHVLAQGSTGFNWTAAVSVDPGAPQWLRLSRNSGSAAPGNPSDLDVNIDPTGLNPGFHFGLITVQAPAANAPRVAAVGLQVDPASPSPAIAISPAGLVFVQMTGQAAPGRQQFQVHNFGTTAFRAEFQLQGDSRIWSVTPPPDLNIGPGALAAFTIGVITAGVNPGIYRSALSIRATSAADVQTVDLLLIVAGAARTAVADTALEAAISCPPGGLQISSLRQGLGFTAPTGLPLAVEARVIGNDGRPLRQGQVLATMTGGTETVSALTHIDNDPGRWSGTLVAPASGTSASLRFYATDAGGGATGCLDLTANLEASANPSVAPGGILSAASFDVGAPLAPGGMAAIFGTNLGEGSNSASSLPLPTLLGATRVSVAGRPAPLIFSGPTQVNAILPYGLAANVTQQLVLRQGGRFSLAELVTAPARAGVFTVTQQGTGQAIAVHAANPLLLADAANPVRAGEGVILYCEGLGELDTPIAAGEQTPNSPLRRPVQSVRVRIAGIDAPVAFAGLTPGLAGLHQINTSVPSGVRSGDEVPVVITVGEQVSLTVTIAVR